MVQALYLVGSVGLEFRRHDQIRRQEQFDLPDFRLRQDPPGFFQLVRLDEGLAHGHTPGGQERIGHAAADQEFIHFRQQVREDADLVADLGAADNSGKGTLRMGNGAAEEADLLFQEEARRAGQEVCHSLDRRVGPMRNAEAVIHIQIGQGGQFFCEIQVVLFFFRMETQVFQEQDLARFQLGRRRFRFRADTVCRERDRLSQQFFQMPGHGGQGIFRIHLPFRASEMRHQNDSGAVPDQILDRRQGRSHAVVVRNAAFPILGNVEVHPDEDALPGHVEIRQDFLVHMQTTPIQGTCRGRIPCRRNGYGGTGASYSPFLPTKAARSTTRLE